MSDPDFTFPVDVLQKEFRGSSRHAEIPMSEGLVPLELAVPGDVVALNNQFVGPNSEAKDPTFAAHDWGISLSIKTDDGYTTIDPISLTADQLRKCAPALFVSAQSRLMDDNIEKKIEALCANDVERRSIVVTQTANAAAVITTSDELWNRAFEFGELDNPNRIEDYVRLLVLPLETAHEHIEMREHLPHFLNYVSKTFLAYACLGSPVYLEPNWI